MALDVLKAYESEHGFTAGIDGPGLFSAPGSPIGVHNPPVPSFYMDSTSGYLWRKVGTSNLDWVPAANGQRNVIYSVDDFVSAGLAGTLGWLTTTVGGGSQVVKSTVGVNSSNQARGVNLVRGGNANARLAAFTLDTTSTTFGYRNFIQEWRINLPTLSTVTQRFEITFGYIDNLAATQNHANGLYFLYDDSVSANWQCVSANGGTRTTTNSGVVASTAWASFRILIDLTQAKFYINENLVATITTNIPTVNLCGPGIKMFSRVGNAFKLSYLDYYSELVWS